jgi:hypothetical protein
MPSAAIIWIWFCAYLNCAGWTLSALHQLNRAGYAVVFALGLAALLLWRKKPGERLFPKIHLPKLRRRFQKAFPLAFLILAALAFLGGALHPPANYDALAYRTPRVLHWLDAQHWHWIHTDFPRLNTRTAGFEWLTAPQFLFLRTDHFVFLLNVIAFLLLPGRLFAVLTRLGVRPRAAWHWMWLLPSGYGFVLQAGSAVNDLFGALMALAAFEFALRARQRNNLSDVWTSGLAAALMTAVKAFNIVLLLPWLIAIFPALKSLLRRPLASVAVVLFALSASMVPTSILDARYCGDWTGAKIENTPIGGGHEVLRFAVNVPNLLLDNFVPPVFPFTQKWEDLVQSALPARVNATLRANFEGGQAQFRLPELQVEESAGLGCGLSLLLLWLLVKKIRAGEIFPSKIFCVETLVPLGCWVGIGVFLIRVGIAGPARYLLPFYFLLFTPLMCGRVAGKVFQQRGWRLASFAVFAVAAMLLVLSPPRPLWPANFFLQRLDAEHSENFLLRRAWAVYSVYGRRADSFAPVLAKLPPDANPLGLITFDDPEASLWRPFGTRRILHICRGDSPEQIRARGIKYALVSERFFGQHYPMKFDEWLAQNRAVVVEKFALRLHAGHGPEGWWLVRFK